MTCWRGERSHRWRCSIRKATPCSLWPSGNSRAGFANTRTPRTSSSNPMGERSSRFTTPVTARLVSCGRWSASTNVSGATFPLNTTHWIVPVPSRSWRKWSFPEERRPWSQPCRVTSWPSWRAMSATWTGGNMGRGSSVRAGERPNDIARIRLASRSVPPAHEGQTPGVSSGNIRPPMSMNERYEPHSIEPRWQTRWEEAGAFRAGRRPEAEPRYVLEMFPYPSGAMHMGHGRVYTIGDAIARQLRMRGFDVIHPIGFDALGLPAENAALKDGRHPGERTRENIVAFRAEMKSFGYSFDWDREIVTADPTYYRWNQWFFLRMLERGIVYRREGKANWCTGCNTVIANEQVVDDNRCERCESPVVEKVIPEWAFRITAFAQDLLDGLDGLTEWP